METVHNAIAWYQKKIGSYDKQLWEESVEKKLLKVPPNVKNAPKKSVRLKTEYIDVDLIRGSTFTKTKPQVPWIYITRKAIARVIFFPFYYKWWVLQTSIKLYFLLLVLYFMQLISIIVYLRNLDHSIVEDELSFTEVTLPVILMFLLCLVHSQTVLAHISHKPPKRTKPIPRVIRPQKTKKTTRKGHRSSGNNSSACQDDSCTSSRSTKVNQVNKHLADLSSSTSKQQVSKDETFSFPDTSQSVTKSGSSTDSNFSAVSKSTKNEKNASQHSLKTGNKYGKIVEDGTEKIKVCDGSECFVPSSSRDGLLNDQKDCIMGGDNHIDRVSSLGFAPTEMESMDGKERGRNGDNICGDSGQECGHSLKSENSVNPLLTKSTSSSGFQSSTENVSSSLIIETLKCEECGKKKCDISMVAENGCQSYHMQQGVSSDANNVNFGKICSCDNGNRCFGNDAEKIKPHLRGGKEIKDVSENIERSNENEMHACCSHDLMTPAHDSTSSYPPTTPQSQANAKSEHNSKDSSYHYYCSNVTEDSGIHSSLSSMDSICSCLPPPSHKPSDLITVQGTEFSSPNYHQSKIESRENTVATASAQIHPFLPLVDDGEGSNLSQSVSASSSSISSYRENIFSDKNNESQICSTTKTTVTNSSSLSSNGTDFLPSNKTCAANEIDTDIDLKDCEQKRPCSNSMDCQHHHHHQCDHHHFSHQTQVTPNTTTSTVSISEARPNNHLQAHSSILAPSMSPAGASHTASSSSLSGIQCFSEQFVQEILNSETLREVSSTVLMNNSDLDCSSSSVTGPLSSASYSSSSSAFSSNTFSLPLKETSSSTLTTNIPLSKHSQMLTANTVTVTTTTAITHSNAHPTSIKGEEGETNTAQTITTTTDTTATPVTSNSTSYLNLPKRRHFASRLPVSHQRQKGKQQQNQNIGAVGKNGSVKDDDVNLDESMEMDPMVAMATTSDADRLSDISNYSPSESDSDVAATEELRNRCEEKRRKQLRFQELSINTGGGGGGTNAGSLSPHLSGGSYKLDSGSPKSGTPNGANVSRSMVNALTRKPSPLKDLSLARKLNGGAAAQASTHSSASDVGKSESTTRSCLRRRRRTSGNMGDLDTSRTRSVPSSIGISMHAAQPDKNKMISSSENEGGEGYTAEGANKATMSSEEWEDRIPLDESTSSNYSSSCGNSDSEVTTRDGEEVEEEEEEKTEYTTSTLHVINLLQPQSGSPSNSGNASQPDKVSCLIWEMNECKKVDLTALDIGWAIIDKVDSLPESSDYFIIGMLFSVFMGLVPLAFRGFVNKSWTNMEELLSWPGLVNKTLDIPNWFMIYTWRQNLLMFNGILQRFFLSLLFFFLLSVADRTFKQRLLYAKHFSYLTSSRRARKFSMPHFRLNKVRNIKIWLSLRSYLKRRGPQRSVDVIVSASFMCGISVVCLISLQMLKDSGNYLDFLCNWEMLVWCLALAVFLLRFMTLGLKINKKYRNLSVLITEQINLYLQMEQKPHKKEELVLANNVLRLAEDLLKELESPFKISGFSANPFIYNITKVIVLSAFSAVLTELLGFKLKLHKIKLKG